MKRQRQDGLTLIEVLVTIVIIGTVFYVLASAQLANLRVTAGSRAATDMKAAAVRKMEALARDVLTVGTGSTVAEKYAFKRYYDTCRATPVAVGGTPVTCNGSDTATKLSWKIVSDADSSTNAVEKLIREGQISISVTGTPSVGAPYTVVSRVSCYDVYPSPTTTTPEPCPTPANP